MYMIKTVMCVRYLINRKGNGLIFPYLDAEIRYWHLVMFYCVYNLNGHFGVRLIYVCNFCIAKRPILVVR